MCSICSQLGLTPRQSLEAHTSDAGSAPAPPIQIVDPLVPNVTPVIGEGPGETGGVAGPVPGIATKFANDPGAASGPGLYNLLNLQQNPDGSYYFTGNRSIDAVLIGSKWSTLNLTYSFPTSGAEYPAGYNGDVAKALVPLNANQQAAALNAFGQLSALTNLTFTAAAPGQTAIIRIAQTGDATVPSAQGQFASDHYAAGDIFFGRTSQPYYDWALKGTWGFATMMHEIGHTMGLKHGHQDYTFSDLSFYFGTAPRYGTRALESQVDGQSYSLMTYSLANGNNSVFGGDKINQPQTYMQFDVAALQYLYGANFNTNSGNTVYSWNAATGEMSINGVGQGAPVGNKVLMTLWDGNGVDTYDLSNYGDGMTVDLRPGAFSTFSQAQLANHGAGANLNLPAAGNVANALQYNNDARSLIENAIGGAGADTLIGNAANNVLTGNNGDDRLQGLGGNDRLEGGAGSDTAVFSDAGVGVSVYLNDSNTDVTVAVGADTDTLNSIENLVGTAYDDVLYGNASNNRMEGGAGGYDNLTGNDGADVLIGGGFSLAYDTSFSSPDITKGQGTANTSRATAVATAGTFDVQANANIGDATVTPHTTILGTAAGGGLEYYRVDVTQAGQTAYFDIDTGTTQTLTDSWINLYDGAGTLLTSNDTGTLTDPGSTASHDDSSLSYTFAAVGIYYIAVGQYTGATSAQPLTAGQSYTLHISLSGPSAPQIAVNASSAALSGGTGDDLLVGTLGNDTISGGANNDTASYAIMFSNDGVGVTVDLNLQSGAAQNTVRAGNDTLTGIENLIGSAYNDTLTGDGGNNVIEGGAGADTLSGGGGLDTASYAGAGAGVTVSLGVSGAQDTLGAGVDTLTSFENLLGSAFADTLTGDATANILMGGAGDDVLNGVAVDSPSLADVLNGGDGSDTAGFTGYANAISADIATQSATDSLSGNLLASFISIENITGGAGADVLQGDGAANVLKGAGGNDVLYGNGGDDRLEGNLGDDVIDGGAGTNDTAVFSGTGPSTVNLTLTGPQATGYGNDTLVGIENLQGGTGVDTFTGDGNANIFYDVGGSAGGADVYDGAGGVDTVSYELSGAAVTVNLAITTAQAASTGGDLLSNIENAIGTAFADILYGSTADNRLEGGAGVDYLQGDLGADVLVGGDGNDVLNGDLYLVSGLPPAPAGNNDVLYGGAGFDTLAGGVGNDVLYGGDGDDTLIGGVVNGTSAGISTAYTNDGGQDSFYGGDGTDIAYAYFTDQTAGVAFNLANIQGNSAITLGGVQVGVFDSIERVIWRGGSGDDVVTGSGTLDTLIGNAGNDTINGFLGNDTIEGGVGDDTLDGGDGLDTLTFVNAANGITVDLRVTTAQNTGVGTDTISNFEYVTGTAFSDTIRGTDDFNLIVDGTLSASTAPGTAGANGGSDSIYGYGGDDMITVARVAAATANTILLDGGDGNDIITYLSGTLSSALTATGSSTIGLSGTFIASNLNTTGSRFVDALTVNAGDGDDRVQITAVASAVIDLGAGADTLAINVMGTSSQSNYTITTGAGADIIQLNATGAAAATTAHTSVVTDFTRGDAGDKFELTNAFLNSTVLSGYTTNADPFALGYLRLVQSGTDLLLQADRDGAGATNGFVTIFTLQNAYTGGFTAYNFDGFSAGLSIVGTNAAETFTGDARADTLSGGAGNDVIYGGAGADVLYGNQDNDVLYGGADGDVAYGGQGNDSVYGDAGDDALFGNLGDDSLQGGAGNDILDGGEGTNILDGGADIDTVTYVNAAAGVTVSLLLTTAQTNGPSTDTLSNVENLTGSAYADVLTGDANANILVGGLGIDTISGGAGADVLYGNQDNDILYGNQNNDVLYGGLGNDVLYGGQGDDVLFGNLGADTLFGNLGADTFKFQSVDDSSTTASDTIADFSSAEGDKIDLRNLHVGGGADNFSISSSGGQTFLDVHTVNGDMRIVLTGANVLQTSDVLWT